MVAGSLAAVASFPSPMASTPLLSPGPGFVVIGLARQLENICCVSTIQMSSADEAFCLQIVIANNRTVLHAKRQNSGLSLSFAVFFFAAGEMMLVQVEEMIL